MPACAVANTLTAMVWDEDNCPVYDNVRVAVVTSLDSDETDAIDKPDTAGMISKLEAVTPEVKVVPVSAMAIVALFKFKLVNDTGLVDEIAAELRVADTLTVPVVRLALPACAAASTLIAMVRGEDNCPVNANVRVAVVSPLETLETEEIDKPDTAGVISKLEAVTPEVKVVPVNAMAIVALFKLKLVNDTGFVDEIAAKLRVADTLTVPVVRLALPACAAASTLTAMVRDEDKDPLYDSVRVAVVSPLETLETDEIDKPDTAGVISKLEAVTPEVKVVPVSAIAIVALFKLKLVNDSGFVEAIAAELRVADTLTVPVVRLALPACAAASTLTAMVRDEDKDPLYDSVRVADVSPLETLETDEIDKPDTAGVISKLEAVTPEVKIVPVNATVIVALFKFKLVNDSGFVDEIAAELGIADALTVPVVRSALPACAAASTLTAIVWDEEKYPVNDSVRVADVSPLETLETDEIDKPDTAGVISKLDVVTPEVKVVPVSAMAIVALFKFEFVSVDGEVDEIAAEL